MNQDFQNQNNFNPYVQPRTNMFESLSLVLGFGAMASCTCFYGAFILGALAIIFGCLSRGGQMRFSSKAQLGIALGIVAIVMTVFVTIGAFIMALREYGSIENLLREFCEINGYDFEALYGDMFQ